MDALQEREKGARLNGNKEESVKILKKMVDVSNSPKETVEIIRQMVKKKGQMKDALSAMIFYAYEKYLHLSPISITPHSYKNIEMIDINQAYIKKDQNIPKKEIAKKTEFLEFLTDLLRTVIEGRIYMEELRIFVTDAIKQIYMEENDPQSALSYIYNVHIETFSSVSVEDIILYQLEQLRISILGKDYEKALIISQRISMKQLEGCPDLADYHWNRMLFVHIHKEEYSKISEIFDRLREKDEKTCKNDSIYPTLAIIYCILDIHRAESQKRLLKNINSKLCYNESRVLGEYFINNLLIDDNIFSILGNIKKKYEIDGIIDNYSSLIRERVLQYNILVVSKYYSRIDIRRMKEILKIDEKIFLEVIVDMIRNKLIVGKIGQIKEIVEFEKEQRDVEEWSESINSFLEAVIKINHSVSNV